MSLGQWRKDKGDVVLRYNYDLNQNSIVFDVGGYLGTWSAKIFKKYKCNVYIYEPVKEFYDTIHQKFKDNEKVRVNRFGLSNMNEEVDINILRDSSTVCAEKNGSKKEKIKLRDVNEIIPQDMVIDLMKINIEGCEYDLLNKMITDGIHKRVKNIQIQFHSFVADANEKRKRIRDIFKDTHEETYNYEFIWENWRLK